MGDKLSIGNFGEISFMEAAEIIAKSGLFKNVKTPEQAAAIMLIAAAAGFHPISGFLHYNVLINRRNGQQQLSLKAEAMLARFQASGGTVTWEESDEQHAVAVFSHPACPKPVRVEWTIQRAGRAGLLDRDAWQTHPEAMLRARVITEGIRMVHPEDAGGMYSPDEAEEILSSQQRQERQQIIADSGGSVVNQNQPGEESIINQNQPGGNESNQQDPEDVRTPKGARLGDLDEGALEIIISNEKYPYSVRLAAQEVISRRKAQRDMAGLNDG